MNNNFKFFSIVLAILLTSSIVLIGCMHVIASDYGEAKAYDMGEQVSTNGSNIVVDDAPTPQSKLQEKFGAMYDVSEDGKTVTVISEEYLHRYWQGNYEKEAIHSLTTEEVFFVIQDSIRLYQEYDTVILGAFDPGSPAPQATERFPVLEGAEVSALAGRTSLDRDRIEKDIHTIILYRLKALSSPKAFFTAAEAILSVGRDPVSYNGLYPDSVFYIPGYSADTDRDYILFIMGMGGSASSMDLEGFTDLFEVSMYGGIAINFLPIQNGPSMRVFPTEDIEDIYQISPYFKLDTTNGTCSLMDSGNAVAEGTYVREGDMFREGDMYALYFDADFRYVFYYDEGVELSSATRFPRFRYAKGESNPIPGYAFEDGKRFALDGYVLFPVEG